ncbi:MAG TPA: gliding motility-associated C-terminal domain-containing protein, partial [Luteibaculaceae bacterium]|nr:gliding motility-associated C-terminal domain-containing protein [Luteibaculaceae bacterium]
PLRCQNGPISFNNTSVGANQFEWNFGDGGTSTDANPQYTFANPGNYSVRLIARNSGGTGFCPDPDTLTIPITIIPSGLQAVIDTVVCKGTTIQLALDSFPNTQYTWNTQAGISDSTIRNPEILVSGPANYFIVGSQNGCFDTTRLQITSFFVKLIPYSSDTLICSTPSFTLVADGQGTVSSYVWADNPQFNPTLSTNPLDSIITVAPISGSWYYVRGTTALCEIIDSIRVFTLTANSTNLPPVDLCNEQSVNIGLNKTVAPGEIYQWEPATFLSNANIPYPVASPTAPIRYKLTAVINGCFEYFFQDVGVTRANLIASTDTFLCNPGSQVKLTADGLGLINQFTWSTNSNFSNPLNPGGDSSISVSPLFTRLYFVRGTNNLCVYTDSVRVRVDFISLQLTDSTTVCANEPTKIKAQTSGNIVSYNWSPTTYVIGGINTDSLIVMPTVPTHYRLRISNADGCSVVDSIKVIPIPFSLIDAKIIASSAVLSIGNAMTVRAEPVGPYNYQWSPPVYFEIPNAFSTRYYRNEPGMIYLQVTDGRCFKRDSLFIGLDEIICGPPNIFVPNAFTPNGDGENDKLFVRGNYITDIYFAVYDRWGERVFETKDQLIGWDGTYKGEPLSPAVFVYYLEITCLGERKYFQKGNVTLIR